MLRLVFVFLTLALCSLPSAPVVAATHPPEIKWLTIETTHFQIHFNARNEQAARRLAGMVEPIHARLSNDIRWVPEEKTHVVLIDYLDLTNGSATPVPYNTIEIYATPPSPNSALGDFDDWLRLVFTHEYTHILHTDQALGAAKLTRDLAGRSAIATYGGLPVPFLPFPNLLLPRWVIEGYATLDESRHTSAGRGESAYADMVLRMAALDDRFFPLDKGSGNEGEWPGGAFRYLYGEEFLAFLAEKYGVEKVNALFHKNAYGLSPFLIDAPAYLTFGRTIESLWEEWEESVASQAQERLAAVQRDGETTLEPVTEDGWEVRNPRIAPDGKTLYVSVSNNYSYPHVDRIDLASGERETLFQRNGNMGPVVPDPTGRFLYFTQLETHRKFNVLGDAYRYDLQSGNFTRLTEGERLLALDVSPDGARVVAVRNSVDGQALVLFRITGETLHQERVLSASRRRVFDVPRFSPDGTQVVYSAWDEGATVDVYVSDLQGNERRLTHDRHLDLAPLFSPDGEYVVFSSERTGIYNLYQVPSGAPGPVTAARLTNVIGGLFEAEFLTGGRLAAASYRGDGFNIARLSLGTPVTTSTGLPDRPPFEPRYSADFSAPTRPYSPGETLWPRDWRPFFYISSITPGDDAFSAEAGISVNGFDVLRKHGYSAEAFYNRRLDRPGAVATYTYDGLWPTITLQAASQPFEGSLRATRSETAQDVPGVRSDGAAVLVGFPFPNVRDRQDIEVMYAFERDEEFGDLLHRGDRIVRRRGTALGRWSYDSTRRFAIGVGPQDGSLVSMTGRIVAPSLGGDYSNALGLAEGRQYVTLPYRQVIALQLQAGLAQESDFFGPFSLGGEQPRVGLSDIGTLPLRGVPLGQQDGNRLLKGTVEYRFPLGLIKRGIPCWGTFPFLADQLHGALFSDFGSAWTTDFDPIATAGAELTLDFTVGYVIPIALGVGAAVPVYGTDEGGGIYVVLSDVNF